MTSIPVAPQTDVIDAVIAGGTSLSDAVNLGNRVVTGILMPAAWTGANLTFQASVDGETFGNVYTDAGVEYSASGGASRFVQLTPSAWAGVAHLKIRSGTAGVPVNQAADRTIKLVCRSIE